jgi:nitrogen fixation NifU-like protein
MDIYQQNILDYYKHPRHQVQVVGATNHAEAANPLCGDRIEFWLKLEGGKVTEVGWGGEGCVLSQAAASMLAELVDGKTLTELMAIKKEHLLAQVNVTLGPNRLKCALLPLDALQKSVS